MDLATIVKYERLFPLALRHPATDEEIGVTFHIRSAESDEAKAVIHKYNNVNVERRWRNKLPRSESLVKEELEKAASYIASWDWGDHIYEGKPVGEFEMKTAMRILEKEGWIFDQVVRCAAKVENFIEASGTTLRSTSE